MATDRLRFLADDILTTIKQTFDDRTVSFTQVVFWIRIVANQLLGQHIAKRSSGAFLSTFTDVPVIIAKANKNTDIVKDRKHIELPAVIFDYDGDKGVHYIAYESTGGEGCPPRFTTKTFTRTTPKESEWLYQSPYTTPSPKNPYWYRTGVNLYFLGLEKVNITKVEMGIYMTIDPMEKIDVDAPFHFPDELMHVLKRQVLDLSRFSFFFPKDIQNTGADDSGEQKTAIPKVVSVNQPEA